MQANQLLITRPLPTGDTLVEPIRQMGYVPVIFPAIDIKDVLHISVLSQKNLDSYHKIVFVSPVSVIKFAQYLCELNLLCPTGIVFFAIGEDTALWIKKKFCLTSVKPVLLPENQPFNADNLLTLPALQQDHIQDQAILLCQGVTGSKIIQQTLETRGAKVTALRLYQRCLPENPVLPNLDKIGCIICTSLQALENLLSLFGKGLKQKKFLVSSEKIQAYMQTVGFIYPPLLAKHAGDKAILAALKAKIIE